MNIKLNALHYAMIIVIIMLSILWITKSGDTIINNNTNRIDSLKTEIAVRDSNIISLEKQQDSLNYVISARDNKIKNLNAELKQNKAKLDSSIGNIYSNSISEDSALFVKEYGNIVRIQDSVFGITPIQIKNINITTTTLKSKTDLISIQEIKIGELEELTNSYRILNNNKDNTINELKQSLKNTKLINDLKDEDLEKILKNHKKEVRRAKWKNFGIGAMAGGTAVLVVITLLN